MRPTLFIIPIVLVAGASFLGGKALTNLDDAQADLASSSIPLATVTTGTTTGTTIDNDDETATVEESGTTTSVRDRDRGGRDDLMASTVPAVNPDGHGGRGRDHAEDDGTIEHGDTTTTPTTTTTTGDDDGHHGGSGNSGPGSDNSGPGSSDDDSGSSNDDEGGSRGGTDDDADSDSDSDDD